MKQYIGDGVYVDNDIYNDAVTTENGIETTNRIVLEQEVWNALLPFVRDNFPEFDAF